MVARRCALGKPRSLGNDLRSGVHVCVCMCVCLRACVCVCVCSSYSAADTGASRVAWMALRCWPWTGHRLTLSPAITTSLTMMPVRICSWRSQLRERVNRRVKLHDCRVVRERVWNSQTLLDEEKTRCKKEVRVCCVCWCGLGRTTLSSRPGSRDFRHWVDADSLFGSVSADTCHVLWHAC